MTGPHSTVAEVMTRDVVTVGPDTPFKAIAALLAECDISSVPVADPGGVLVGLVSEADLLRKQAERPLGPEGQTASPAWSAERAKARAETAAGLMTTAVCTARPGWSVPEAARAMDRHRVKRLVVVDEADRVVGIVSRSDLLGVFLRPDEEIGEEILDEILDRVLRLDERQVQVHVRDGVVTLRGAVEFRSTARIAERLALGVDGVVAVRPLIDYAVDDTPAHAGAREDGPGHRHA